MRLRAKLAIAVMPMALTAMVAIGAPANASVDAITSPSSTTAYVGSFFSFTVTTTGSLTPGIGIQGIMPAGVTFTNNGDGTATISGTPPPTIQIGMYTFRVGRLYHPTIVATFRSGRTAVVVKQVLMLAVDQSPIITNAAMKTDRVGIEFTFTVKSKGYPVAGLTETGPLPGGVTFTDNRNGKATLAGTPTTGTAGTYPLTITASNGVGSPATQNFTLVVKG